LADTIFELMLRPPLHRLKEGAGYSIPKSRLRKRSTVFHVDMRPTQ
jgi:hypothetical protein